MLGRGVFEALPTAGIDHIMFSIHGVRQDTAERYMDCLSNQEALEFAVAQSGSCEKDLPQRAMASGVSRAGSKLRLTKRTLEASLGSPSIRRAV